MASFLLVLVLSSITVINPTCSASERTSCESGGCFWIAGRCKALEAADCVPATCAAGCVYSAGVPTTCVDTVAESCASSVTCTGSDCTETGTCSLSTTQSPPSCEAIDDGYNCPDGCENKGSSVTCVPEPISPANCVGLSTAVLSQCAQSGDCKWEDNACVPNDENDEAEFCGQLTNDPASQCTDTEGLCGVNSGLCVSSTGLFDAICSEIGVANCVAGSDGGCFVEGNTCKFNMNYFCSDASDPSECDGICKLDASNNCVFDTTWCNQFSTTPLSECTAVGHCKVSASNVCGPKTEVEECATLSTVRYNPCQQYGCKVQGEICVSNSNSPDEYCSYYSVENTLSECSQSNSVRCEINSNGQCVPNTPDCRLNAAGTGCDPNNRPNDKCEPRYESICEYVNCNQYHDGDSCTSANVNNFPAGCVWNGAATSCVSTNPLNCDVNIAANIADDTCFDSSCTRTQGTPATCVVGSVTDTVCGASIENNACGGVVGCKWVNEGGTCVEKNCSNSASYATCCGGDPSCEYCTSTPKPSDCPNACTTSPSYANCCGGNPSCEYCTSTPKPSDCPNTCTTSYATCCGGNPSCEYCTSTPKPSDCPNTCTTSPSYSNCCTSASCEYCTTNPRPNDCPTAPPNACSNVYAPVVLLIAVLFIGWL